MYKPGNTILSVASLMRYAIPHPLRLRQISVMSSHLRTCMSALRMSEYQMCMYTLETRGRKFTLSKAVFPSFLCHNVYSCTQSEV